MTEPTTAELRALLERATPGPWRKFKSRYGASTIAIMQGEQPAYDANGYHVRKWPEIIAWPGFDGSDMPKGRRHADARLIVAAVNALPALLDQLDAQAARIAALETGLRPFAKAGDLFDPRTPGGWDQLIYNPAAGVDYQIVGDDLRRARQLLGGSHAE